MIKVKKATIVDSKWIEHFPEHRKFLGNRLDHHHIDHGPIATGLPKDLHTGKGNSRFWHQKLGEK